MLSVQKVLQLKGHTGAVYAVSESENTDFIYTAGSDGFIARWDIANGVSAGALAKVEAPVFSLFFNPDSHQMWAGREDGGLHIIDLEHKTERKLLKNHTGGVFSIVPVGDYVITTGGDGTLALICPNSLETQKVVKISENKVRSVLVHSDKNSVFTTSADGKIRGFDSEFTKKQMEWNAHKHAANTLAFLPDGSLLSGGRDARLKRWDIQSGKPVLLNDIPAHNYAIYQIKVFEKEGVFITCSRDKTLKIWDIETLNVLFRISRQTTDGHKNSVNNFLFLPETQKMISVSDDSQIMVWEVSGLISEQ